MSQTQLPIEVIDAFTSQPYRGNPAAVCILDPSWTISDAQMQSIALEMNHAETAFVTPLEESSSFSLRWFTPSTEVDLCGHATLATAHSLFFNRPMLQLDVVSFKTKSGILTAQIVGDFIELDFPALAVNAVQTVPPGLSAIAAEAEFIGQTSMDWFFELTTEQAVLQFQPNLRQIESAGLRGVIITAKSQPAEIGDHDFVSRFFAPQSGVNEDSVTGSAHCALAPYWQSRLGRPKLMGYQASPRGGFVQVEQVDSRVKLRGQCVTTLSGIFHISGKTLDLT